MSHAVVFFPHTCTSDVVPASSVIGDLHIGSCTKVKWGRRSYTAKVLFTGPQEICEMKVMQVTADGEMRQDVFDLGAAHESPITSPLEREPSPSPAQREYVRRLVAIEEKLACATEILRRLERKMTLGECQEQRTESMLREILRRQPIVSSEDELDYRFTTVEQVAALRKANSDPMKFIRCLEEEVFREEPEIMEIAVDSRVTSVDKIDFMKKSLFKFFGVPSNLREEMWRRAKTSLNSRARRLRKLQRDGSNDVDPGTSEGANNDAFEWGE